MNTAGNRDSMPMGAITFALSGETDEAELLIYEMTQQFPTDTYIRSVWIPLAEAMIELENDHPDMAVDLLTKGAPYERSNLIIPYIRGRALRMLGRYDEALAEYQKLADLEGVDPTDPIHTLAHFGLARAHADVGDTKAARQHYENFFSLMADADDGLPTVEIARQEYAALQ